MEISYGIAWLRHRRAWRKAALLQAWLDDVTAFHKSRIMIVDDDVALQAGNCSPRRAQAASRSVRRTR